MSENELKRVLSNPDNLIISESLKGRIDLGEETLDNKSLHDLVFSSGDQSFTGRLREFCRTSSGVYFCFSSQESFLDKFLKIKLESSCEVKLLTSKFSGKIETFEFSTRESELQVKISILEDN